MPREFSRTRRVGEQIRRLLAETIHDQVKDPRVGMVTLTGVEVSRDLGHARIFFTVLSDAPGAVAETLAGLERASGFLRREIGRRIKLRSVPELRFEYDRSVERGRELSALIDRAVNRESANDGGDDPDSER